MPPTQRSDHPVGGGPPDRDAQIQALATQAAALNEGVIDLMEGTGHAIVGLAKRGRSTRRLVILLAASLALDLLLTFAITFTLNRVDSTGHRVDKVSSNIRTQLCAMLQIFVNVDTPQANAIARARGDDMAARAASFRIIHRSYNALTCAKVIKK